MDKVINHLNNWGLECTNGLCTSRKRLCSYIEQWLAYARKVLTNNQGFQTVLKNRVRFFKSKVTSKKKVLIETQALSFLHEEKHLGYGPPRCQGPPYSLSRSRGREEKRSWEHDWVAVTSHNNPNS